MNYKKIHDSIIERAKHRVLTGYKERHHIVPKCMGGIDSDDNIIELTAKEHFIIHKLLCEIYPDNDKLIYAIWMMSNVKYEHRTYHISGNEYERIRTLFKDKISNKMCGSNNSFFGKVHTVETRKKMKIAATKRKSISEETRKKMSIAQTNRKRTPFSENVKRKMSESRKGYVMSDETKQKLRILATGRVVSEETKKKLKKPKRVIQCPHCNKSGGEPQMKQWHFNNCKYAKTK
jgi:hypothetical protein